MGNHPISTPNHQSTPRIEGEAEFWYPWNTKPPIQTMREADPVDAGGHIINDRVNGMRFGQLSRGVEG